MSQYTAQVAQALFLAASQARDAGISASDLFSQAHVDFSSAGRVGLAFIMAFAAMAVIGSACTLATRIAPCGRRRVKAARLARSSETGSIWAAATFFAAMTLCAYAALFTVYGHLAAQQPVAQGLHSVAFFILWLAMCYCLVARTKSIPLLEDGNEPVSLSRPLLSHAARLSIYYVLPLPILVLLLCQLQESQSTAMAFSATLSRVAQVLAAAALPTDLLDTAHPHLGQSDYETLLSQIYGAFYAAVQACSHISIGRAIAALVLVPLAICLEVLTWRRLARFMVHAHNTEISASNRAALPRLLRLPSLYKLSPSFCTPAPPTPSVHPSATPDDSPLLPPPALNSWWPEDVPLVRNGLMTPRTEAEMPRLPASALLRAATLRNAAAAVSASRAPSSIGGSSVASPATSSFTAFPERSTSRGRGHPTAPLSIPRAPSTRRSSTIASTVYPATILPSVGALDAFRRKRVKQTIALTFVLVLYAMMEIAAALAPGDAVLLPLIVVTLALSGRQVYGVAMTLWETWKREEEVEQDEKEALVERKWAV